MNKIGIYYAYWEKDWTCDFFSYLEKVKTLGFDVLEVNADCLISFTDKEKAFLKEEAERTGVALSACIGTAPEYDIASTDQNIRKAGMDYFRKVYMALNACGIDRLGGITYSCWPGFLSGRGAGKEEILDISVKSVKELMNYAEDLNITVNLEVLNRFEHFLINTAEEGVEFCERVGSSNCKLLLDTFHMNIEEDSIAEAIRTSGNWVGHIHFGESNRKVPGSGHVPWEEIIKAIKEIQYKGYIVFEPFVIPGGGVAESVSLHRELVPGHNLDEDAEKACSFIKSLF